jgi:uncharacterized protein
MRTNLSSPLFVAVFALAAEFADAENPGRFPEPKGLVSDYVGALSSDQASRLVTTLSAYEKKTTTEIAVVVVRSIQPETNIDAYATALFNQWGIGKHHKNNGVLLLVALHDRKVRLEIGKGLVREVPDDVAARILAERVIPAFKNGKYAEGIMSGVAAVMERLDQRKSSKDASGNQSR